MGYILRVNLSFLQNNPFKQKIYFVYVTILMENKIYLLFCYFFQCSFSFNASTLQFCQDLKSEWETAFRRRTVIVCVHLSEYLICAFLRRWLILRHLHHRWHHFINRLWRWTKLCVKAYGLFLVATYLISLSVKHYNWQSEVP